MAKGTELAHVNKARKILATIQKPAKVKEYRDKAAALKDYFDRQRGCLAASNDAAEHMIWAEVRLGELFGAMPRGQGRRTDLTSDKQLSEVQQAAANLKVSGSTVKNWQHESHIADEHPDEMQQWMADIRLAKKQITSDGLRKFFRAPKPYEPEEPNFAPPEVWCMPWDEWLPSQPECDLLLTDPPYMTDVEDVAEFAEHWLPEGLLKVKDTGRAYVCIGAYPDELHAYLNIEPPTHLVLEQVLVWTYRNTLGQNPSHKYKLNWQAILYYLGKDAPSLTVPKTADQFSVFDINAPDGRLGDRCHTWQKPEKLANIIVQQATREGDVVLDPFCCTGTFLLAANRFGRVGRGCDIDQANLDIAIKRGCVDAL